MVQPWSFWLCGCFGFLGHLVVILVPLPSQDEPHPCLLSGWMSPVGPCPPPLVFFAGRLGGWVFVLPLVPLVIVQSIEPTLDGVFFRPGGLLAPCRVVTQSYPWIPIVDSTDGLPMLLVHYHQPWCLLCEAGRRESFSSITPLGRLDRSWSFCWAVDRWLS